MPALELALNKIINHYFVQHCNMQQVILHYAEEEMNLVVTAMLTQNSSTLCQHDSHVQSV